MHKPKKELQVRANTTSFHKKTFPVATMPRISTRQRILKHLHSNLAYTEELLLQEYSCEEHDDELMYDGDDEKDCIGPVDVELLFLSTSEEIEYVQSTHCLLPRILSKTTHNIFMEDLDPYSPYRLDTLACSLM